MKRSGLAAVCMSVLLAVVLPAQAPAPAVQPSRTDDLFWIASMTKPITAVCRRVLKSQTVAEMLGKQTGDLPARPEMPWGLGFSVVQDPQGMEANRVLSPGSFGHGGAYSTQSWADPTRNLIWVLMFQRNGKGNPDNSDVRIAFQEAARP